MNTKLWASANELINRFESTNKMYFSPWPPFPPPLDFGKRPNCLFYFGTPSRLPLKGKLETKAPITSLKAICKRYYHTDKVNWSSWLGNVSYRTCNSGYWFEYKLFIIFLSLHTLVQKYTTDWNTKIDLTCILITFYFLLSDNTVYRFDFVWFFNKKTAEGYKRQWFWGLMFVEYFCIGKNTKM